MPVASAVIRNRGKSLMNAISQIPDVFARRCDRFEWCDGRMHNPQFTPDETCHTRSELFVGRTLEVCLSVYGLEQRAYVYVDPRHQEIDDDDRPDYSSELFDPNTAMDLAAEYRRAADAITRAARDVALINLQLAEAPC